MSVGISGYTLLLAIAGVLSVALLVGWFNFGRMPYALFWAAAAAGEAAIWLVNAVYAREMPESDGALLLTAILSLCDSMLVVVGAFRRAGRRPPLLFMGAAALAVLMLAGWGLLVMEPRSMPLRGVPVNLFAAAMFLVTAMTIRPPHRPANFAEYATVGAALLFAACEIGLAAAWLQIDGPHDLSRAAVRTNTLFITMPFAYVAAGVAAMMLIAFDLNDRLQAMVTRDALTGVFNRRGLEQAMLPPLANARRRRRPLTVLTFDVGEGLRSLSSAAARRRLTTVADALSAIIREEDIFGHLGNGAFCIVLIDTDAGGATIVAERMRAMLAGQGHGAADVRMGVTQSNAGDLAAGAIIRRAEDAARDNPLSPAPGGTREAQQTEQR